MARVKHRLTRASASVRGRLRLVTLVAASMAISLPGATTTASASVLESAAPAAHPVTAAAAMPQPAAPQPAPIDTRMLSVPSYLQTYQLSCEESALRMALASEGIQTTDAQLLALIGVDRGAAYFDSSGLRWSDPYSSFVGDPNGSEVQLTGYGTYYPTIAQAAAQLGGQVIRAGEGVAPADVYAAILAGHPVVVWVTYQWVIPQRADYTALDGRVIPYAGPVEHAVTVVGVTPTEVYVNNPDSGPEVVSKAVFEAAYATYNQMAVVLG